MSFRHPQILDIARAEGRVTVDGLAARLGVTVQTIRRDLGDLAAQGALTRVHGGAVLPSGVANIGYGDRRALAADAKEAIGRACATLIPDRASVFLNIGTTTEAVARALRHRDGLMVVTNNLNVATTLAEGTAEVVVTGGTLRRADGGLTGGLAASAVDRFRTDVAVIGCSGVELGGDGRVDVLDFDPGEVEVAQAILRRARRRILVADHLKVGRAVPVRIAGMDQVDVWVTDRAPPAALAAALATGGPEVIVAG